MGRAEAGVRISHEGLCTRIVWRPCSRRSGRAIPWRPSSGRRTSSSPPPSTPLRWGGIADALEKPLAVVTLNADYVRAVERELETRDLTVICIDPRFRERFRLVVGGDHAERIHGVLIEDDAAIRRLDPAGPVLISHAARARRPDLNLPTAIPPGPVLVRESSAAGGRERCRPEAGQRKRPLPHSRRGRQPKEGGIGGSGSTTRVIAVAEVFTVRDSTEASARLWRTGSGAAIARSGRNSSRSWDHEILAGGGWTASHCVERWPPNQSPHGAAEPFLPAVKR